MGEMIITHPITRDDIGENVGLVHGDQANYYIYGVIKDVTNDSKLITININNQLVKYTTDSTAYSGIPELPEYYLTASVGGKRKSRRRIRRHSRRSKRTHKKTRRYIRR